MSLVKLAGKRCLRLVLAVLLTITALFLVATYLSLQPVPDNLSTINRQVMKNRFLDRYGRVLNVTYENHWNLHDVVPLHDIPIFMQQAIVASEDKRFYRHHGVDWLARFAALKQDVMAAATVRGASTITEQVIKILHPRPRTFWTRWLEGFEAQQLEQHESKQAILEFYLNQVPYAARRHGIKQAAAYYFDRDLATLSKKEMLALAVMVRSPTWFNPYRYPKRLDKAIDALAKRMYQHGLLDKESLAPIYRHKLVTQPPQLDVNAEHFIDYLMERTDLSFYNAGGTIRTSLDRDLQYKAQRVLDAKLAALSHAHVQNGAVLIVDHRSNEILAWVVGNAGKPNKAFNRLNPVVLRRQPGSALKPFLYTRAFEKGWTAATMLSDTPLEEGVGSGLHSYHNYSRDNYGLISVRESLGNSLNIPAVRTIQFVGTNDFLQFLHKLGIHSLQAHPNVYGDGIALGDGEVTLYELTQAYTTLARMGSFKPLSGFAGEALAIPAQQVIDPDIASLIANILSDPHAREREFGTNSILDLPQQTAVKTGTSSDYRDAWAIGFNDQYTIGVWFGNLDYTPMHEITGSSGPAIVLRTLFNELNRGRSERALYFSPHLEKKRVCIDSGLPANGKCQSKDEWFVPGTSANTIVADQQPLHLRKPTNGLLLAMDPRIPAKFQMFEFELSDRQNIRKVDWYVNGVQVAASGGPSYQWQLQRGNFSAYARVYTKDPTQVRTTNKVNYTVK